MYWQYPGISASNVPFLYFPYPQIEFDWRAYSMLNFESTSDLTPRREQGTNFQILENCMTENHEITRSQQRSSASNQKRSRSDQNLIQVRSAPNEVVYGAKTQKKTRNFGSIVLKNFSKFYYSHPNRREVITDLMRRAKIDLRYEEFQKQLFEMLPPKAPYVRYKNIKQLLSAREGNREQRLLVLLMLRKFINTELLLRLNDSKKLKREDKDREHKYRRVFWKKLLLEIRAETTI